MNIRGVPNFSPKLESATHHAKITSKNQYTNKIFYTTYVVKGWCDGIVCKDNLMFDRVAKNISKFMVFPRLI
jgi:hypothetical protein